MKRLFELWVAGAVLLGASSASATVTIHGTEGSDRICLYLRGDSNRVCVNGVERPLPDDDVVVHGAAGNDNIVVNSTLTCSCGCGFAGVLDYDYAGNTVTIWGESGNDTLVAGHGFTALVGGPGNDRIRSSDGYSLGQGDDGDDVIVDDGATADDYVGGGGNDCIEYTQCTTSLCDCDLALVPGAMDRSSCTNCMSCEFAGGPGTCAFACPTPF